MKDDKYKLLSQVAYMYFIEDISQQKISEKLGIYRTTISRLIKEAREKGIVEINVRDFDTKIYALETHFQKKYHLKFIQIVPTDAVDSDQEKDEGLSRAGAAFIKQRLEKNSIIGVSWGRTLAQTIGCIENRRIEKDNENNWFVVSQGIGDSGLKNGQYQLLIKIPTDFSSKILDIDKERPESLDVSYQINNNGDTRITTLASAKGNEIIKDLEQSLINVYFASILSNFHTAQNNIEKVGDVQLANVTSYNKDIYTGVNQVKSSLPRLIDISKGSSEGNTRLTDSLDSFTTGLDGFITSQDDHDSQLQKLLQKNSEGLISYGQFSDEIVGLSAAVSSEGTKKVYEDLRAENLKFQANFSEPKEGETVLPDSFQARYAALSTDLETKKSSIDTEIAILEKEIKKLDKYKPLYEFYGKTYNSSDPARNEINVEDLLNQLLIDPETSAETLTYYSNWKNIPINDLPFVSASDWSNFIAASPEIANFFTANPYPDVMASLEKIEIYTANEQSKDPAYIVTPNALQRNNLVNKLRNYFSAKNAVPVKPVDLVRSGTLGPKQSTESDAEYNAKVTTYLKNFDAELANYNASINNYQLRKQNADNALNDLMTELVRMEEKYTKTSALIDAKSSLEKINLKDQFKKIVDITIASDYQNIVTRLTTLNNLKTQAYDISSKEVEVSKSIVAIKDNVKELTDKVDQQFILLDKWKNSTSEHATTAAKIGNHNQAVAADIKDGESSAQNLLQQSKALKQTSASNVTSSKATQTIFDNFNKSVEMIKQNGDTLFENTEKVKGHFDNEVQANSGFITQFKGVFVSSSQALPYMDLTNDIEFYNSKKVRVYLKTKRGIYFKELDSQNKVDVFLSNMMNHVMAKISDTGILKS